MWPICHNSRKPVCSNEDPVQPKIKYKLIKNKKAHVMWNTQGAPASAGSQKGLRGRWSPGRHPPAHPGPQGPPFPLVGPQSFTQGHHMAHRRRLRRPWQAQPTHRRPSDGRRPSAAEGVPEPVKQEEDAGRREAPSAPCASPAAGAPGGSGPRGSYCKAQSERLLKMFSGL